MPRKTVLIGTVFILFTFLVSSFFLFISPRPNAKAEEDDKAVLVDFKLEKTTINTDAGTDTLTVYARASTTEPEGSMSISVYVGANPSWEIEPENGYEFIGTIQEQYMSLSLMTEGCDVLTGINIDGLEGTCGDYTDGIFAATFTFPRYSAIGDWMISDVNVSDSVGDGVLQGLVSFDDMTVTTASGDKNVAFSNVGLLEDTTPPVIEDYVLVPSTIDTTSAPASITMYMRVSEDLGEVSSENDIAINFAADNDPGFPNAETKNFTFSLMTEGCDALPEGFDVSGLTGCGDATEGIYSATAEIPAYSLAGTWSASGVWNLKDTVGNTTETCSATFENTATVYDDEAPVIQAVTITPTEFDTTDAAQTVTFDIEITDDVSGVASINISLVPIVVGWEGTYWLDEYTITEGDALDGTFRLTVELPQGAPIGFWRVNNIDVEDTLGRSDRYTTSELSLAFPSLSLYLLNQGTTEEVTLAGDWTLEDWPYYDGETVVWPDISVRFTEGTTITKEEGGVFAFQRMLATKYDLGESGLSALLTTVNSEYTTDLADCDASEGCVGTTLNSSSLVGTPLHIVKFGIPGLNLTFSKPVTIILGVDPEYLGQTFVLQTFDEEEGEWVNHGSCTVAMVIPPSTEHGGDQYGVTKPIAYPGCSFTTDHASFFSTNVLGAETEVEQAEDLPGVPKTGFEPGKSFWINKYLVW